MSIKQYLVKNVRDGDNVTKTIELYENGVMEKTLYCNPDDYAMLEELEDSGYQPAYSPNCVNDARLNYYELSQHELAKPRQQEFDLIMYCPKCATRMLVKGDIGSRRCYCKECNQMFVETFDAEAIHQRSWKLVPTI